MSGHDLIDELVSVTRDMADAGLDGGRFGELLHRRGELVGQLTRHSFDPSDSRLQLVLSEGTALRARMQARRHALREEMESMNRNAIVLNGVQATLSPPPPALDVQA